MRQTCRKCKNELMMYHIQLRQCYWHLYSLIKPSFAMVCPSDASHNVDLLFYDVWL